MDTCPFHPEGGCGLQKLGTYGRVAPPGTRVPRWWCPRERCSVSLLPNFLAARWSGTLDEVEAVVATVEEAGGISAAVELVHPSDAEIPLGLDGAKRSITRRLRAVYAALLAVITLLPDVLLGVPATLSGLRAVLSTERVLVSLRSLAARHLASLPAPLGFRTRGSG